MPTLPLETLPWILLACMVTRTAIVAIRLAAARDQLRQTRERLETFTHSS
jgi:hypothetical protein